MLRSPLRSVLVLAAFGAALALAGCGVKGPLEPPPDSPPLQPRADGSKVRDPGPVKPDRPFVLDGLL